MAAKDARPGDRHTGPRPRMVRGIEDETWAAVQAKARAEGVTVSAVVARLLAEWLAHP